MAEPDAAAEHADFTAGETSLPEGQQGMHTVQCRRRGGSPVNHNGRFPKGFSGDLQV